MTAEWVYRQVSMAGHAGAAALRKLLKDRLPHSEHRRLVCRVHEMVDEECPQFEDRFLCILISGCICTAEDNVDTDLQLELMDITDGASRTEPVLSVSEQWQQPESPVFFFRAHNGNVPSKNAQLAGEITVARIPLHLLRFAYRGRRRIQATVSILSRPEGQLITRAQDCFEHVCYSEGFVELQERRETVLRACIELACAAVAGQAVEPQVPVVVEQWIQEKTRRAAARSDLAEPLTRLQAGDKPLEVDGACECLLAWGQKGDRMAALDLSFQILALYPTLTSRQEDWLWTLGERLGISPDRFQVLCQKRLLTDDCPYDRWRLLLGVRGELLNEELRRRLNEEYRKWNARVTHHDPEIRRQADIILSLIAEVRNRQQKAVLH